MHFFGKPERKELTDFGVAGRLMLLIWSLERMLWKC